MFDHYKMFTNNIEAQGNAIEQFAIRGDTPSFIGYNIFSGKM